MTAVTTASAAWVQCAGIAAVVIPLYLAFIFREFVLCRIPLFAWLQARLPSDRTGTSPAVNSHSPRGVGGTTSKRGQSVVESDAALTHVRSAWDGVGHEISGIQFNWKVCQ